MSAMLATERSTPAFTVVRDRLPGWSGHGGTRGTPTGCGRKGRREPFRCAMGGRARTRDLAWRWIASVLLVAIGAVVLAGRARAAGGVDGAQAIAFLNQQRAANGIPSITTTNENYAAAWCPDEDHGPPGGETWRDWSPFVDWTADSSPWTNAPLHQISMYDPRMDTAGDVNVDGQACMGLGRRRRHLLRLRVGGRTDRRSP